MPSNNHIALTIDSNSLGGVLLWQPIAQNKRQAQKLHKVQGVRHFAIAERMGMNPLLSCWCGASLELNYVKDGMSLDAGMERMADEVNGFADSHENCEPRREGQA